MRTARLMTLILVSLGLFTGCEITPQLASKQLNTTEVDAEGFVSIFNGKDLTGWTPKFAGEDVGVNYKDTFVVEQGILKADYSKYEQFDNKFAHLFYETPYSHYILRFDYRFVGDQIEGGPSWAAINSGVMFHSQSPESMAKDQQFPVSVEAQTLGQAPGNERKRTTGNVCTPGTNIVIDGKLVYNHCISSSSKTFRGDQWVSFELEVHGHGKVIHRVNGEVVHEYEQCQLAPNDKRDNNAAKKVFDANGRKKQLSSGYFALQAESHPVHFRNIRIKLLEK